MEKIDNLDMKIIKQLLLNSRQSDTQIAKKVRRSKQVVSYRIRNLVKEKIIKYYFTALNLSKLGLISHVRVFFKLQNADLVKEKEIIEFLSNNDKIPSVSKLGGRFDIAIVLTTKNNFEVHRIIREIMDKYGDYLSNYELSFRVNYHRHKEKEEKVVYTKEIEVFELNDIEKKLLSILTKDARMNVTEIASKLKLPVSTTISKIKKLEKEGIIQEYTAYPDLDKLNLKMYHILVSMKNVSTDDEHKLNELIVEKNVDSVAFSLGRWDVEFILIVKNSEEVHDFTIKLRSLFSNIQDIEIMEIFKEFKYDFSICLNLV
ncbi:winged helix-turn-helix transcriptional regulator [Nanoarchaeota archaeon]